MGHRSLAKVVVAAAAIVVALGACSTGDYGALAGTWVGQLNESQYYTGLNPAPTMTLTIVLGSDKTWSWKEVANYNSATASFGNGTFTLDSTAKTLQLTITTSSSTDVLAGTVVNSGYTIASDGKSVTFDLKAANGTGTGTVILAKQ